MNPGPASARTLKAKRKQSYEKNKEKELSQSKEYYKQNAEAIKIAQRKHYDIKCEAKKASVREYYGDNAETKKASVRKYYADNVETRKASVREYYADNAETRKASVRKYYADNAETRKASVRKYYADNAETRKASVRKYYADNAETKKVSVRKYYANNAEARKTNFRKYYADNAEARKVMAKHSYVKNAKFKKALSRKYSKWQYALNPKRKITAVKVNYLKTKKERQVYFKNRYALSEPKQLAHDRYNKIVLTNILGDTKATREIVRCYKGQDLKMFKRRPALLKKVVSSVASKKLVNCALAIRKKNAGTLISIVKSVTKNIPLKSENDFGDGCHCASSEPYFYDAAYGVLKTYLPIPVTPSGQCVVSRLCEPTSPKGPLQWECTIKKCKRLSDFEIDSILSLREAFDEPMHKLRKVLHTCDSGCPYEHFSKSITSLVFEDDSSVSIEHSSVERKGHPLVCYVGNHCSDYACKSKLRILRAAATHYPTLRNFLNYIYSALKSHMIIYSIDMALHNGDYQSLLQLTDMGNFETIFNNDVNFSLQSNANGSGLRRPNLETYLAITHANVIAQYEKEVDDNHEHPCICCEQLYQRKNVVRVKLSDDLDSVVWPRIKSYVLQQNPTAADEVLFICNYCKKLIKNDKKLPSRCVLNGLEVVPIPPELRRLDSLSSQFIQLAKCYQTVVRLGTYFGNVPSYNSLKACKGSMFFLPLPLENTLETLDKAKDSANRLCALPNPELYIIVNGKPTKGKVVWRSLVDINHVKQAVQKLKEINWLYRDIDEQTLDEAAQQVKEVVTNTTSTMLVKATKEDIAEFQSYTIRNMDNKMSTGSDLEQYKVQNVQEDPLDNRQKYLDVMCFPVLFPTGQFGEHHPREVKLDFSQYIKSRLWNKDSRFRKTPQYVFYLLWQKGLRDVNAGIYSVLNTKKSRPMSVGAFMSKMGHSDEHLEASLSSIFSSVRGSSQYWFQRKSEVQCMIREYGSPTLFLTFSCAEYESPDIIGYLRKINGVSDSYSAGRLCTEDPISVSRKFSANFHAFFQKVLIKGGVLGTIDHYYWKKEYQARGAPHYHALVWITDAPVIGQDSPESIVNWIDERMTCHIPNEKSNPELHRLVTRYQMHKCGNYCKRRRKLANNTFITTCKFNFPRQPSEKTILNCIEESLKSRKKIYYLQRTEAEVRVNDYHPLLLSLWKANMDIQFCSESSLALAHYVSGYVTKAEKSNLQDVWKDIGENKSIYSRLFSFAVKCLRSREVGLYEASDLLTGEHLYSKSVVVQWIDVSMPDKRSRRLKDYSVLKELEKTDPDCEDIYKDGLIDTFYPNRPSYLEDVCLYDFVANYEYHSKKGVREYRRLKKPRLVNHKVFDPQKEEQRESYYYSLIVLFVPFIDESSLVQTNETAEEAFHRLVPTHDNCSVYHAKLQKALEAQMAVKKINEAREALGKMEQMPKEDNDPQLLGEAKTAMKEIFDMNVNAGNALSLDDRVDMLNADQRRVFDNIKSHLVHQVNHENGKCQCSDLKPLTMFVSGVGGTGKSFLIETIKELVNSLWSSEDVLCAVAAPTGLAAFNIGGITMHRLFQLPIEHPDKAPGFWPLSKDSQKAMRTTLRNLKMLIIDEVSMVSSLNLAYINLRLQEIFGGSECFGSKNVLFVGDLLQLLPVKGEPVFAKVPQKDVASKLQGLTSVNFWKDSIVYDELTINERQKKDQEFSSMLDCVRRGCPTEETMSTLQKRIIDVSPIEKFLELQESGQSPVCLFPRRAECAEFNDKMLSRLPSKKEKIACVDEIDQTSSTRTLSKQLEKKLSELNNDCNLTAGLEFELTLAEGARVMLRRNIDTKAGLVNGALGTVKKIAPTYIRIKFDHDPILHDIERVKGKFMIQSNLYVFREQFPLILAYAVTIHKCQGLSLDCAIIDLNKNAHSAGIAYVALSRVRSLTGLHLISFDPNSIVVSAECIQEINRLRTAYRSDLPIYTLPTKKGRKRTKLTGCFDAPEPKKPKTNPNKTKRPNPEKCSTAGKRSKTVVEDEVAIVGAEPGNLKFHTVNVQWQRWACALLGLEFIGANQMRRGGPHVALTPPHTRRIKPIGKDGNCLFRCFSYMITGSEDQHFEVRAMIVTYMPDIAHFLLGSPYFDEHYNSIQEYIADKRMDRDGSYGSHIEMLTLAYLLRTTIYSYNDIGERGSSWCTYSPSMLDRTLVHDTTEMAMYIRLIHAQEHFEVVLDVTSRV